jgi:ATP-binding cassette subfamily B (MDR/TAP) protein 1
MTVGIICALVAGGSVSIFSLLWGDIIDNFKSKDELVNQTYNTMLKFVYIGLGILVLGAIMIYSWVVTGERQSNRCKKLYLQSIFSQEIGWFETGNQFEISSDFSVNCEAFQSAIGHNIPFIFNVIGIGISGIVIALFKGWLMTIVTFISIPLMILAKYTYSRILITK